MRPIDKQTFISKGMKWKIHKVKEESPTLKDFSGKTDVDSLSIYIPSNCLPEIQWQILFHEIFHVIAQGFHELELTEEWGVSAASGELMSIIRQLGLLD